MAGFRNIRYYAPSDFRYPAALTDRIVAALDNFTGSLGGRKAVILSDWRPFNPERPGSRHTFGDAIDAYWPALNPLDVLDRAEKSGLFDGLGVYLNNLGAVSFHFDQRGQRARWGALISASADPNSPARVFSYTTLAAVVEKVKTIASGAYEEIVGAVQERPALALLLVGALLLFLLVRSS